MVEWATKQPDGTWRACDPERNQEITAALEDLDRGGPLSALVRDSKGRPHPIGGMAYQALFMAVSALDAQLRPDVGYRPEAPEIYAALARSADMATLRRAFEISLPRNPDG